MKKNASTNMVGLEYNKSLGIVAPFIRVEIPRHDFTFDEAVNKIIELNREFDFDVIMLDAGSGEYQYETLVKYGLQNPESGLHYKIIQVNFSEVIYTRDPYTKQKIKKDIKPFMVNNLVKLFERGQIALNPSDKEMIKQFEDYVVERWGKDGRPIYTDKNEHIHDCVMLAYHGFILKFSDMLKTPVSSYVAGLRNIKDRIDVKEINREIKHEEKKDIPKNGALYVASVNKYGRMNSGRGFGRGFRRTF
ncbi:MAG: hypothetical protein N2043_02340 [Ignavibacterium sp.]|nr:hypothetical protein [Ignavibacterium sp.]